MMVDVIEATVGGWTSQNTMLVFDLPDWQVNILQRDISEKLKSSRVTEIYIADKITDLYAVPHAVAILNFSNLQYSEQLDYFEHWRECSSPMVLNEQEMAEIDDPELVAQMQRGSIMPLTFIMNFSLQVKITDTKLFINKDIFAELEMLKMLY